MSRGTDGWGPIRSSARPVTSAPQGTPSSPPPPNPHLLKKHLKRDVVLDTLVEDGDGTVGAQKVGAAPVVVRERIVAHAQRRIPLHVARRTRARSFCVGRGEGGVSPSSSRKRTLRVPCGAAEGRRTKRKRRGRGRGRGRGRMKMKFRVEPLR